MNTTTKTGLDYVLTQPPGGYVKSHPASQDAQVAITVFVVILAMWSTFGNALTMLAIGMNKDMRRNSNYFIFSLAFSDLISGMIASPLWLYRKTWGYHKWLWGDFLCKLFWSADVSTTYCTALHVASFAIWRYIGIRWPLAFLKVCKRTVLVWILSLWIVTVTFVGTVYWSYFQVEDRNDVDIDMMRWPSCSLITTEDSMERIRTLYTISSSVFMLFPMAVLFSMSFLIAREILTKRVIKSHNKRGKEKRAIAQLALISSSFLLGYIPNLAYVMWTTRVVAADYRLDYWVNVGCYFALRLSECLNPIVYNISSKGMRISSKRVVLSMRERWQSIWMGSSPRTDD